MMSEPRTILTELNIEHSPDKWGHKQTKVTTTEGEVVHCNKVSFEHVAGERPVVTITVKPHTMNLLIKSCQVIVIEDTK